MIKINAGKPLSRSDIRMKITGNIFGAFADGAILFPLMAALVWQTGMNGTILLATAGLAYLAAGAVFRVPMSVQPLKSVVVAALAVGATATEIHLSGFIVGVTCLILSFCYADKLAAIVPRHLVHGLQLGLGVILMFKGAGWGFDGFSGPGLSAAVFVICALAVVMITLRSSWPVMGWLATLGILAALYFAVTKTPVIESPVIENGIRFDVILALVLPQLALTLTNSVVGTYDVSRQYFGDQAKRVRPFSLLRSIGIGNICSAGVGGLPFCHGAGGITAHVKGGAVSWHMNLIIGGGLLALALLSAVFGLSLIPAYPQMLMAVLIFATGVFHMQLASSSWQRTDLRAGLVLMAMTALVTQNMLWVLVTGIMVEASRCLIKHQKSRRSGLNGLKG